MRRGNFLTAALVAILLAATLAAPKAAASFDPAPTRAQAVVAEVVVPTSLRSRPGGPARELLRPRTSWSRGPVVLLVLSGRIHDGAPWVRVRLAGRPNGDSAWVPADRFRLRVTPWRVVVNTERRDVYILRGGQPVRHWRAVIGKQSTPTPTGLYAIYEKQRQDPPAGFLGPWALHITAHSNVHFDFGGGKGRVAIHGRDGASLNVPLGSARSNGCIRIDNGPISFMARLPLGTPFEIR